MCIAIYKPAHLEISRDILENCFINNPDGAGFAYINVDHLGHKKIIIYKTMEFSKFYDKYTRAIRNAPDSPFLLHFRIATHGVVDTTNCHPFFINKNMVFIHNGVISKVRKDKVLSDTQVFNEDILKKLNPSDIMKSGAVKDLIENYIVGSKIAVLTIDGEHRIFNESSGLWKDGIWFSNTSYMKKTSVFGVGKGASSYSSGDTYNWGGSHEGTTLPVVKTKTKTHQRYLTAWSQVPCDGCGNYHRINDMFLYVVDGEEIALCKQCNNKEDMRILGVTIFDTIFVDQYINLLNQGELELVN